MRSTEYLVITRVTSQLKVDDSPANVARDLGVRTYNVYGVLYYRLSHNFCINQ